MPKILLVEDDNNLREIFQMRLEAEGYQTVTAADGEEGLVVAMKEKPDLVIADVMMPKLSGFEMVENLRSAPEMKDTKVVMMTALGQAEDQARGEKLGVVKYLVKSQVTLEDFARVVKEVLGPGNPSDVKGAAQVDGSTTNSQESETSMQEDPQNNPAPAPSDMPAPSEPAAPAGGDQGSAPAMPSGDMPSGDSSAPAGDGSAPSGDSGAPAMPAGDNPAPADPTAPAGGDGSSAPTDPTSQAL
jgi:CheY-like chemotaxis protein